MALQRAVLVVSKVFTPAVLGSTGVVSG